MSKIITSGPFALVASANANLADMGLTAENCLKVYEVDGDFKSWRPGGTLNNVTAVEAGKGYIVYVVDGETIDLTEWFDVATGEGVGIFLSAMPTATGGGSGYSYTIEYLNSSNVVVGSDKVNFQGPPYFFKQSSAIPVTANAFRVVVDQPGTYGKVAGVSYGNGSGTIVSNSPVQPEILDTGDVIMQGPTSWFETGLSLSVFLLQALPHVVAVKNNVNKSLGIMLLDNSGVVIDQVSQIDPMDGGYNLTKAVIDANPGATSIGFRIIANETYAANITVISKSSGGGSYSGISAPVALAQSYESVVAIGIDIDFDDMFIVIN